MKTKMGQKVLTFSNLEDKNKNNYISINFYKKSNIKTRHCIKKVINIPSAV